MSSILKALRKVEDEKASMGQGGVDLAHDILKRSYEKPKKLVWPYWLLAGVILFAAAIVAWMLINSGQLATETPTMENIISAPVSPQKPVTETQLEQTREKSDLPEQKLPAGTINSESVVEARPLPSDEKTVIILPDLRIDEIVYHESPASRLAVVNDLPVMEGTDIEGARVVEILPDRVRFVFEGVAFNKFTKSE